MKKVGIFDSGIGGMMIAKKAMEMSMPADIYYVSDDQFNPYGNLDEKSILDRSIYCTELLLRENVELVTVACNTATAAAIAALRERYPIPFVGVEPDLNFANRELAHLSDDLNIGVLTTPYTEQSQKFMNLKDTRDPKKRFTYLPLKNLAKLVEQYFYKDSSRDVYQQIVVELKNHLAEQQFDYLVLGCTHYEFMQSSIEEIFQCKCISPSQAIAKRMIHLLGESYADSCPGEINFLSTIENNWTQFPMEKLNHWPR